MEVLFNVVRLMQTNREKKWFLCRYEPEKEVNNLHLMYEKNRANTHTPKNRAVDFVLLQMFFFCDAVDIV